MGRGFALALSRGGHRVRLLARRAGPVIASVPVEVRDWAPAMKGSGLLLIATPDDAITGAAAALYATGALSPEHVVLHLSGLLDHSALAPLAPTGAALGSFHPLQTVADPATAPERLAGAYAAVEGDARAIQSAEGLADALGMHVVRVPAGTKPAYHAGAALVANATLALVGTAVRIAEEAGIPPELARRIYLPLLRGTLENLEALGPAAALTGPVRRGDLGTIRAHLAALGPDDRELYRRLGLAALDLARRAGLEPAAGDTIERFLLDED